MNCIIRKIKSFFKRMFCKCDKLPENTYYGIIDYVWECSKCGKKHLYMKEYDAYMTISNRLFYDFVEKCVKRENKYEE